MNEEKNLDAGKQKNQPQDKADKEHLNDEQLDKVAGGLGGLGGLGGFAIISLIKYITDLTKKNSDKSPGEFSPDPGVLQNNSGTSGK